MKKIITVLLILLVSFSVVGCTKDSNDDKKDYLGTYTSSKEGFDNQYRPNITFNNDNSFRLYENDYEGLYLIEGKYTFADGIYTLKVKDSDSVITFTKVNDTDIKLNTDIDASTIGDIFTTKEIKNNSSDSKDNKDNDDKSTITYLEGVYYSDNQQSFVEFTKDGIFVFTEIEGMGACLIEGNYVIKDNIATLSATKSEIYVNNKQVTTIEFEIEDEGTIILKTDLQPSKSGDVFKLGPSGAPELEHTLYVYEKGALGLSEPYLPYVEFNGAGEFLFHENYGEGMYDVRGHWTKTSDEYICTITDGPSELFIDEIRFKIIDDTHIKINTNVSMTMEGDVFKLTSLDYLNK